MVKRSSQTPRNTTRPAHTSNCDVIISLKADKHSNEKYIATPPTRAGMPSCFFLSFGRSTKPKFVAIGNKIMIDRPQTANPLKKNNSSKTQKFQKFKKSTIQNVEQKSSSENK